MKRADGGALGPIGALLPGGDAINTVTGVARDMYRAGRKQHQDRYNTEFVQGKTPNDPPISGLERFAAGADRFGDAISGFGHPAMSELAPYYNAALGHAGGLPYDKDQNNSTGSLNGYNGTDILKEVGESLLNSRN